MPSLRGATRRSNLSDRSPRSPDVWRPRDDGCARCSLICVGSELLRGKINTHSSLLARRLASISLELSEEHTVGDDLEAIAQTIRHSLEETQIVLVTGGLGPTFDDLTREAASVATGKPLVGSPVLLREIQVKFRLARYRAMPPANKRQSYLLDGATPIANRVGTAPGQWLDLGHKVLILMPGPPAELEPMLGSFVIPRLRRKFPAPPRAEAHLHFVGVPESVVDHKVRSLIERAQNAEFTILAHLGLVDLDVFASGRTRIEAARRLSKLVRAIRRKTAKWFYGMNDDYPLEKVIMKKFVARKATLAVAESCTGGMLAKRLTDVSGSSDYFAGGIVSYSNEVKKIALGVSPHILRSSGAVSKETALAMAKGVRQKLGTTWGIGITGIAGPTGGTRAKPVGLVFIGLAGPHSSKTLELRLRGSRDAIRRRAVAQALDLLRLIYL